MVTFIKVIFMSLCLLSSVVNAGPVNRLEGIKIQADNEAPQVMYVIPWQSPKGAERLYTPVTGVRTERLKPVDPYTFEREHQLHKDWLKLEKKAVDLASD